MKVFCIISDERAFRSKSPAVYTEILKHTGISGAYVPFKVLPHQLGQAIQGLRAFNLAGANVTVPYKETVIPFLDAFSEGATMIGAVNTIVRHGDTLKGYNTNAVGFMDALKDMNFDASGKTALVLGNGGMAKAVVFILNWLLAETIYITGRSPEKTARITEKIGGTLFPFDLLDREKIEADILINATSVSDTEEAPELASRIEGMEVPGCRLFLDLNYGRRNNFWERWAKARGIPFTDGLSSLVHQARRSFLLWTGIQIPPGELKQILDRSGILWASP